MVLSANPFAGRHREMGELTDGLDDAAVRFAGHRLWTFQTVQFERLPV